MASKLCDSCKSATASLFCRADSAFLCTPCDSKIHAANKLASRHARVVVCEVCEQSPAQVTCKADAASLCAACDRDIHSANPLAGKHHRVPIDPFYDSCSSGSAAMSTSSPSFLFFGGDGNSGGISKEEEAEAASWLLPNPKGPDNPDLNMNTGQHVCGDPGEDDPYSNVDQVGMGYGVKKIEEQQQQNSSGTDGVVPVRSQGDQGPSLSEGGFVVDFSGGSKGFSYGYDSHCFGQTVSSSSLDFGVVPEGSTVTEVSNICGHGHQASSGLDSATNNTAISSNCNNPLQLTSAEREARVMRYREKRKNRKFEKTIRYASRKAYAEARPRVKGRFAKRSDVEVDSDARETEHMLGYGIVPSF